MNDQKIENLLNLALQATPSERMRSPQLSSGFDPKSQRWEVIVLYQGNLDSLMEEDIEITYLLNNYAILSIPYDKVNQVAARPEITFMEKPKALFFAVDQAASSSCIRSVQKDDVGLFGKGVLIACIDSGVDYTHPDFRNPDGSTRFLSYWDQTLPGSPPKGYRIGTEFTRQQLNDLLLGNSSSPAPTPDISGHGTAVLGIAAGNGAASQGVFQGVAPQSYLLAVKLGTPVPGDFPRTTQLIQAVDYAVRFSLALRIPLVINLSFGNNYGSHNGDSLLETYLDSAVSLGQISLCIGSGNEGNTEGHTSGSLVNNLVQDVEFSVGPYETNLSLQLWKYYVDSFSIELIHPSGFPLRTIDSVLGSQRLTLGNTELLIYYGMPSPYSMSQEIYFDFLPGPGSSYIDSGIWILRLIPRSIVEGIYHLWLPGGGSAGTETRFFRPTPETTLTIPSTASRAITVGAYDSRLQSYADYSGRGYTRVLQAVKPDLAAPGTGIRAPRAGGGYHTFTGTSFATPFVSGSAALMMEWGIILGNDPFLYGEKIKARLIKGARRISSEQKYPNPRLGYGILCLKESLFG